MPAPTRGKLNMKQRRFVTEITKPHRTQAEAAIKAGYKAVNASIQASRLLSTAKVREAVLTRTQQLLQDAGVDSVKLVQELKAIAHSKQRDDLKLKAVFGLLKMDGHSGQEDSQSEKGGSAPLEIRVTLERVNRTEVISTTS